MKKPSTPLKPRDIMIVFEGPECTGKSTIVSRLLNDYSCPGAKRVRTPGRLAMLTRVLDDINEQQLRTSVGNGENLIVFDRWQLVSDILYEKYFYGRDSILEPLYPTLAQACRDANILIVYLDVDRSEMVQRYMQRGDALRTVDDAILVNQKYQEFFLYGLGNQLPFVYVDSTGLTIDEVYKRVINEVNFYFGYTEDIL